MGLYSAQKLQGERLKCFALSISMQTKAIGSLQSLGLENIPQVPANFAKVAQNHDARKAVSSIFSVLK